MIKYYILDGRTPVPASMEEWSAWFEKGERVVAVHAVGDSKVSTVFLGLDHNVRGYPTHIFETMVFDGPLDGTMERYSTWDEAETGHAVMLARVLEAARRDE